MLRPLIFGWAIAGVFALCFVSPSHAHDVAPEAPKVVREVDGSWPPAVHPSTDVVVPILVTVSEEGLVSDAAVDVSLGAELDAAALVAAKQWLFLPAHVGEQHIAARARIAVRFRASQSKQDAAIEAAPATILGNDAGTDAGVQSAPDATTPLSNEQELGAIARVEAPARSASEVVRDRAALSAAPHRTASDLLLEVPGLFITQHSGEGKAHQIFYRGFDAVHGQDVEVWVGGAPVNEVSNIHGQGYADLHFIMPEVVRTLRASPGTYDPRQGDFAIAGTMRFELGYDQPGITAKAGYGSFDTRRYFLGYRPKTAGEGTFAAAELYQTDGFGPSRAAQRASAVAQGTWRISQHTSGRLLFTGYAGHFDSAGVLRLSDIQTGRVNRFDTYDPRQGGASTRAQLVGEVIHKAANHRFSIAPYLVFRNLRLRQNFTGFLLDGSGDSAQQLNEAITFGGTASYRMKLRLFSPADALEAGIAVRSDWVEQSQKRLDFTTQRVTDDEVEAKIRAFDVGTYLDAALHPHQRVVLRGGVRLDGLAYFTRDDGAAASGQARASQGVHVGPKATVEVSLVEGLSALLSYGEGFRSPQARSLAESESTPFTKVRSMEGGLRLARDTVQASAAVFQTWLSEDLVFDPATVRNEKVPATQHTGVTADASYRPLPWLLGGFNLTYTRAAFRRSNATYAAGDLVPYTPQWVTRADVAATPKIGEWHNRKMTAQVGFGASALLRRPLPYSLMGHDIFLLDAQAGVRWGEVALHVKAFNLLDRRWYDGEFMFASSWNPAQEAASLVPARHVTVGSPRTVFASLEIYL